MKIKNVVRFLFVAFTLVSCFPTTNVISNKNSITPSAFPTLTPLSLSNVISATPNSTLVPTNTTGYVDDWRIVSTIMPAVREYFYYRKQAEISGSVNELWAHYPELKNDVDNLKGINAEELLITAYQGHALIDGNVNLQAYEPVKIKVLGDKAEAFVHGQIIFLWIDEQGNFQEAGGEIKIVLFMQKDGNKWTVYKTDQYRQGGE